MRYSFLLMGILLVSESGCAMFIKQSGVKLDKLEDRETVHQQFGFPVRLGQSENLQTEEFLTHRKISEVQSGMVLIAYLYTLCLYDLVAAPLEAYESIQKMINGQKLKVYYDTNGKIQRISVDGFNTWTHRDYYEKYFQSDKK